jgi:hypothetical protein
MEVKERHRANCQISSSEEYHEPASQPILRKAASELECWIVKTRPKRSIPRPKRNAVRSGIAYLQHDGLLLSSNRPAIGTIYSPEFPAAATTPLDVQPGEQFTG